MEKRQFRNLILLIFLFSFFSVLLARHALLEGRCAQYRNMELNDPWYRAHFFDCEMEEVKEWLSGDCAALYRNVKREAQYFPVPGSSLDPSLTVSYVDTWNAERNYKGKSGHEGTDIMAGKDERGIYPVVSMTDGVVSSLGWLEKGGWRVGITAESGTYYYYAHLDSYGGIREGDEVKAGEFLGYMGDSGYGDEGTKGKFPVHLHVGIYTCENDEEISVNPYYVLKSLEDRKLRYSYSQR